MTQQPPQQQQETEQVRIERSVQMIRELGLMNHVWDGMVTSAQITTTIATAIKAGIKKEDFLRVVGNTWDEFLEIEGRIAKGMANTDG